ncbi:MAG TPA: short chain dehydrogenase [Bdellovibrionota bacterium]|jgi:NAD(P)-dependent dehydrogenase (short-subunit alcohol dehydrogenase family)|nr:short chain dehydrogenase [Bdellovibrionota bacterium]
MKKIVVIGAEGTIGKKVTQTLEGLGHEVIRVGKSRGQHQVKIEDRNSVKALFEKIGAFDAVVNAAGDVAFAPFEKLGTNEWNLSLSSKLMGQVHLVQEALPYIREKGSFTLVSGILSEAPIFAGVAASTVNRAIEGFVMAAAAELPKGLRINVVSPTVLVESMPVYGPFFPGFVPVPGEKVAQTYVRSILGVETGKTLTVNG